MHLGMSGSFRVERGDATVVPPFHHERPKLAAHDHVVFDLDNGARVVFNDPRRFGSMDLVKSEGIAEQPPFDGLGVEPLSAEFDAAQARRAVRRRAGADQDRVARPEAHRRPRQHLRLRGAAPRAHHADPSGGDPRRRQGQADRRRARAGRRRSAPCSRRRSRPAARRCATTASLTASSAISSIPSPSTTAKGGAARAAAAAERSRGSSRAGGRRSIARRARNSAGALPPGRLQPSPSRRRGFWV